MDLQKRLAAFKNVTLDGYSCSNPTIDVRTISGVDIACIKPTGEVVVYVTPDEISCLEAWISCSNCLDCPPIRVVRCFCDDHGQCPGCHRCNEVTKVCDPICGDKVCVDDDCVECSEQRPCKNGAVCNQGKCECPPGWKRDQYGICRECLTADDCSGCDLCIAFGCKPKTCAVGVLNPTTCSCVTCYNNSHCTEPNTCCTPEGKCECCTGYYRDPITGGCVPKPPCVAGECPPCHECQPDGCEPTGCAPGRVHVGTECCMLVCDCNNPNCPPGYTCVNKGQVCVCVNCDVACDAVGGCPDGCECKGFGRCGPKPKDPCDAYCDENTPCPNGCGCNLQLKKCENCSSRNCTTPNCEELIGCKCRAVAVGNLAQSCQADPCNSPCTKPEDCGTDCGCNRDKGRCEECDRPCTGNEECQWGCYCDKGTKRCKKNPCAGKCQTGKDCGPGCGCWDNKGCYPCSSFDCVTCAQVSGCDCNGGSSCDEHKTTDCLDLAQILKIDSECKLDGRLTTDTCCDCPDLGYGVDLAVDASGNVTITRKLRKGHDLNSTLLDQTGVYKDFPPILGANNLVLKVTYADGTTDTVAGFGESWAYVGTNALVNTFTSNCAFHVKYSALRYDLMVTSDIDFAFENGCKYFIPAGTVISVPGCNNNTSVVVPLSKRPSCKLPLFKWYKGTSLTSMVKFREYYPPKNGNLYRDVIGGAEGVEIDKYYELLIDYCGCDKDAWYSCYGDETRPTRLAFCQPLSWTVTPNQALCNTEFTINELTVCSLYEGKSFELWINGTLYGTYTVSGGVLFAGGLTVSYGSVVTEVRLKVPGDECKNCDLVATFSINNPCNCSTPALGLSLVGLPSCTDGFQWTLTGGTGPYTVIIVRTIPPVDHEADRFTYDSTVPHTFTFNGALESGDWYVKVIDKFGCEQRLNFVVNCCNLGNPNALYDCALGQIVINSVGNIQMEYQLNHTGSWILLPANKRITASLSNGTYPGYVSLRRVDNVNCNTELDLNVNCDDCALIINSATLNAACTEVTITSTPAWDEVSIGGTGSWGADTNPIALGSALTPGNSQVIYVRVAANPTCYKSVVVTCTNCPSIDIGTPDLDFDCTDGTLTVTGLDDPPSPTFPLGCTIKFQPYIDGVAQTPYEIPIGDWDTDIDIMTGYTLSKSSTTFKVDIFLVCPGATCTLGSVTKIISVTDDLGTVTYNCTDPDVGLRWTGGSSAVQVLISGVWTNVAQGQILLNGSYLIRTITAGAYCTVQKTVNVHCSGGGGGTGDPCIDFANYITAFNACEDTVTIGIAPGAPNGAYLSLWILNDSGDCADGPVWQSNQVNTIAGGSVVVTGVPLANRVRAVHYSYVNGGGDTCSGCAIIGNCSNGTSCLGILLNSGHVGCSSVGVPMGYRKLTVTNPNLYPVLVYVDNLYKKTLNAGDTNIVIANYLQNSTHNVKLVCLGDPTTFTPDVSITLSC